MGKKLERLYDRQQEVTDEILKLVYSETYRPEKLNELQADLDDLYIKIKKEEDNYEKKSTEGRVEKS